MKPIKWNQKIHVRLMRQRFDELEVYWVRQWAKNMMRMYSPKRLKRHG